MTTQLSLLGSTLIEQAKELALQIGLLPPDEAIEVLNQVKIALHEQSPMKDHPVDCVVWVPASQVIGNAYNPNRMSPKERQGLTKSIQDNGYAMPVVVIEEAAITPDDGRDDEKARQNIKRIVDGFNRSEVGKTDKVVKKQTMGYLPISHIRPGRWELTDRMAATIQFNVHGEASIEGLSDMVLKLSRKGWAMNKIAEELNKEPDMIVRLLQGVGLAEVWKDSDFSRAWEMVELLSLERALKIPTIDLVVMAELEGHTLIVEQISRDCYQLQIDDEEIQNARGPATFTSAQEMELAIQQHLSSYQPGKEIWYEGQDLLDDEEGEETEEEVLSSERGDAEN